MFFLSIAGVDASAPLSGKAASVDSKVRAFASHRQAASAARWAMRVGGGRGADATLYAGGIDRIAADAHGASAVSGAPAAAAAWARSAAREGRRPIVTCAYRARPAPGPFGGARRHRHAAGRSPRPSSPRAREAHAPRRQFTPAALHARATVALSSEFTPYRSFAAWIDARRAPG
ncbi:hypothetical protein AQ731_01615 [Burkholderia pseudomallei]|nr:hypothetical protein A7U58_25675 [Burkholderia pseudomallei]ANW59410.1 hypothetical protein A7U59_25610 [Burkholderia pseudomallei]APD37268.1 hypothetical protein BK015_18625 [Burkholderia pseudomallei]ARK44161.1 hypothetical protein BOC60_28920 [Burkholderia pseudomallei]OMQ70248.1 hypothetical protein AQ713_11935 [Burkholderia pseudomallei]